MMVQKKSAYNVAIVGATGAVGQTFLDILSERNFPINELKLLASSRSAGKKMEYNGKEYTIEELTHNSFEGVDIALFSAGASRSKEFAPSAVKAGAIVVDNSSAFRMDKDVPLVVPEVNPEDVQKNNGIIANPNCTTIIMLVPLKPLHDYGKIKRVVVSSYQSASGAGAAATMELMNQAKAWSKGEKLEVSAFAHQLLFNVIPHIDAFTENGYTKEEMKLDVDGVFVYIGQIPQTGFLSNLGILNERGFINVDKHFETSVKGLFAIGDCIDKEVRQIATAVGDAATAIHYLEK